MASSTPKDLYEVLGVNRTATATEISSAYKRKILEWHPDRNPHRLQQAKLETQEIIQAGEMLRDPTRKEKYDRSLDNNTPTESFFQNDPVGQSVRASAYEKADLSLEDLNEWLIGGALNLFVKGVDTVFDVAEVAVEVHTNLWWGDKYYRQNGVPILGILICGLAGWLIFLCLVTVLPILLLAWLANTDDDDFRRFSGYILKSPVYYKGMYIGLTNAMKGYAFWLVYVSILILLFKK